jgi:hypothetical protein
MCLLTKDVYALLSNQHGSEITSLDQLDEVIKGLSADLSTTDIVALLQKPKLGVCPRSYPIEQQSMRWIEMVNITGGGEMGSDLLHLPYDGNVMDQPNKFYDIRSTVLSIRSELFQDKMDKAKKNAK